MERKPKKEGLYVYIDMGFPGGSDSKESARNAWELGWIPGLVRSPGEQTSFIASGNFLKVSVFF